jgi:hypothetical protein
MKNRVSLHSPVPTRSRHHDPPPGLSGEFAARQVIPFSLPMILETWPNKRGVAALVDRIAPVVEHLIRVRGTREIPVATVSGIVSMDDQEYREKTRNFGNLPVLSKSYIFGSSIPMPKTDHGATYTCLTAMHPRRYPRLLPRRYRHLRIVRTPHRCGSSRRRYGQSSPTNASQSVFIRSRRACVGGRLRVASRPSANAYRMAPVRRFRSFA